MTDDEDMLGYVMDLLEPAERRAIEHRLATDAEAARRVEELRATLAPLAADREPPVPPPGLAARTLALTAAYMVEHEPDWKEKLAAQTAERPTIPELTPLETPRAVAEPKRPPRVLGGWFRADVVVAAGIGFLVSGLVISGVGRMRTEQGVVACQNNLATLHKSLVGYADTHDGRFPQVGDEGVPTAGSFTKALHVADGDTAPARLGFVWHDPAADHPDPRLVEAVHKGWNDDIPNKVQYAYTLGYRGPDGKLCGLRRHDGEGVDSDLLPIAGDLPAAGSAPNGGPTSPHRNGHNILYVGGHVRYLTSGNVGVDGDDIFRNQEGKVAAGLHRNDSVLGRPGDRP